MRRFLVQVVPPLLVFSLARLMFVFAGRRATPPSMKPESWARWDSGIYVDIARQGYTLLPCPESGRLACGNAGWMPGYPWLTRLVAALTSDFWFAAYLVSGAAALAFLFLIWMTWIGPEWSLKKVLVLGVVAFAPGSVYQHASFPISMALVATVTQGLLLQRSKWLGASVAGAACAATYTTGFLVGPVGAVAVLLAPNAPLTDRFRRAIGQVAGATFGFVAVLALHHVMLDTWDALFKVQAKYGHAPSNPFTTWIAFVQPILGVDRIGRVVALQIVLSAVLVVLVLIGAWISWKNGGPAIDTWAAVYAVLFFFFPLCLGVNVSPIRAESLLAPSGVLLRWLPLPLVALWVLVSAWMSFEIGGLFFHEVIV